MHKCTHTRVHCTWTCTCTQAHEMHIKHSCTINLTVLAHKLCALRCENDGRCRGTSSENLKKTIKPCSSKFRTFGVHFNWTELNGEQCRCTISYDASESIFHRETYRDRLQTEIGNYRTLMEYIYIIQNTKWWEKGRKSRETSSVWMKNWHWMLWIIKWIPAMQLRSHWTLILTSFSILN